MNEEAIKVYSLREWQIRISAAGGGEAMFSNTWCYSPNWAFVTSTVKIF